MDNTHDRPCQPSSQDGSDSKLAVLNQNSSELLHATYGVAQNCGVYGDTGMHWRYPSLTLSHQILSWLDTELYGNNCLAIELFSSIQRQLLPYNSTTGIFEVKVNAINNLPTWLLDCRAPSTVLTSLFVSSGAGLLLRMRCATLMTCSSLRGCSSTLAARNRQADAMLWNEKHNTVQCSK